MRRRYQQQPQSSRTSGSARPNGGRGGTSTAPASSVDSYSVRGVIFSDFDHVDTLTSSLPFRTRVCACNAKPSGILCTCRGQNWPNTPQAQCCSIFSALLFVLFACSVIPTLMGVFPSVMVAHILAARAPSSLDSSTTSVSDNIMEYSRYVTLGAVAHAITLIARVPWLSFRRSVYSRAVVILRTLFLPRAMVTTACSVVSAVILYFVYATSAGVGSSLAPGVRGGSGDHVWGQMLYVCPSWGTIIDENSHQSTSTETSTTHGTCVNNVQWLSFVSAVAAGVVSAFHYLYSEMYIVSFPSIQRRRLTRLCPRIARETRNGPLLACISTACAYVFCYVLLSRETKHWVISSTLYYLYGNVGIHRIGGLLDTTDPRLAHRQSIRTLDGLFLSWCVSVWVHLTMSISHHMLVVLLTHALHSNVANNLMTWSTWLVSPTVRGRYRVGTQGRWDASLTTKSTQRSTTVVMNEVRRRQERASRKYGTQVNPRTAITTDGDGPLQFTPRPYTLKCVLDPLGEWGEESEDRNDDGIEALLMSLSIARPGSLHEKFLRWVPPSRRYVHVIDKETGDSLLRPHHHTDGRQTGSNGSAAEYRNGGGYGAGRGNAVGGVGRGGRAGSGGHTNHGGAFSNRMGVDDDSNNMQYSVGDSLRGAGLADHHGGIENTRMREYDGIRSTVPPHRVLQMIGERRFYEVLQHHANEQSEEGRNFDYFDEVRQRDSDTKSHRSLYLKEEIARMVSLLHLKSVADHDEDKLRRLFNAQHGDAWIECVRLSTAKIDSLTMSLQLMSTINVTVKPGWEGKEVEPLDLGVAPNPVMARLRPNSARVHEWKKRSTNRSRRRWKLSWIPEFARKWLWWWHEWQEMSPSHAAQRLRDQMNDNHHNLAQWTLQGIDPAGQTMFQWVEWPREAAVQLESAFSCEHTRVTVRVPARQIWSDYETWAKTRAETLDDSDDENDMTDPDEVLTLIVDLETDHGEWFEAISRLNSAGKGAGPCHSFRVRRTPRGHDGELLRGEFFLSFLVCFLVLRSFNFSF